MKYPTRDLIFLSIQTNLLGGCVYKEKSSHEWDIHSIPRKSTAQLIYPKPLIELTFLFDV